jgi:glycosyltransferase involved in cell wall biosynthesis
MNQPLVTVIMAAYNGERYIRQALDSALAQTYPRLEVVVVNDGSTDSTPRILAEYGDRIRWFTQPNAGQAAARHRAISHARGEWLALLDQDDLWDPCKIDHQVEAFIPEVSIVHCNARQIDHSGQTVRSAMGQADLQASTTFRDFIVTNRVIAPTALFRQVAYHAVGGFDPANRFGTEDYQLWLRLAARRYRFRFVDEVLASWRVHGSNASLNPQRMALGEIYSVRQTRREYPRAFGKTERRAYHSRLHQLEFDLAWHLYDQGEYGQACSHFWMAVRHQPTDWQAWSHALATSLPWRTRLVPRLRASVTGRHA